MQSLQYNAPLTCTACPNRQQRPLGRDQLVPSFIKETSAVFYILILWFIHRHLLVVRIIFPLLVIIWQRRIQPTLAVYPLYLDWWPSSFSCSNKRYRTKDATASNVPTPRAPIGYHVMSSSVINKEKSSIFSCPEQLYTWPLLVGRSVSELKLWP